jgi:hypothetical protein
MGFGWSDQLIQPLFGNRTVAVVNVNSVSSARRLSIDEHAKSHGGSSRCRSHDELIVAEKLDSTKALSSMLPSLLNKRG